MMPVVYLNMRRFTFWVLLLAIAQLAVAFQPMLTASQQRPRSALAGSSITYTLQHPFHTVKGESTQINSQLFVDDDRRIQQVSVSVPVRSFDSGNRARDRDMLKVTEADEYPDVSFISSEIVEQNGVLAVKGELTFHGVKREIQFTAQEQRQGQRLLVAGEFEISLEEFGVKRPSILTMKVKDNLQVQFRMLYPAE